MIVTTSSTRELIFLCSISQLLLKMGFPGDQAPKAKMKMAFLMGGSRERGREKRDGGWLAWALILTCSVTWKFSLFHGHLLWARHLVDGVWVLSPYKRTHQYRGLGLEETYMFTLSDPLVVQWWKLSPRGGSPL